MRNRARRKIWWRSWKLSKLRGDGDESTKSDEINIGFEAPRFGFEISADFCLILMLIFSIDSRAVKWWIFMNFLKYLNDLFRHGKSLISHIQCPTKCYMKCFWLYWKLAHVINFPKSVVCTPEIIQLFNIKTPKISIKSFRNIWTHLLQVKQNKNQCFLQKKFAPDNLQYIPRSNEVISQ